jgi:hypothetical protein
MTTCKQEAERWVHRYALGGAAFSAIPLPVTPVGGISTAAAGGALAILGQGLKWVALQGSMFVPVAGTAVRMGIAAATIESLGRAIIGTYERKYPGKVFTKGK